MRDYKKFAMLDDQELRIAVEYFHNQMTTLRMGMNEAPKDLGQAGFLFEAAFLWEIALEELHTRQAEAREKRKR